MRRRVDAEISAPASSGADAYLHSLAVFGMRPGLERVRALLERLGEPQRRFRAIHVVGTNGKSSTTRYCEAVVRAQGVRSGAYLSPHITGFHERVLVDGRPLGEDAFAAAVDHVRAAAGRLPADLGPVTQFEALTVAAFLAFAEAGVEAAAVEAGLGGRLDATNVLDAPVVVVTSIGLDHTEILGDTREAVFAEKAAVITGGDAVFGRLDGLEDAARAVCRERGARALLVGDEIAVDGGVDGFAVAGPGWRYDGLSVPTLAAYQAQNAGLAVAACHLLLGRLELSAVRRALAASRVPGRLQVVRRDPLVLADGAHNPDGTRALAASLATIERHEPRVGLVAIMRDKGVGEMLEVLCPLFDCLVCVAASESRSLAADELARLARATPACPRRVLSVAGPRAALDESLRLAGTRGSVVVTGSLYLLADLAWLVAGAAA